MFDFTKTHIFNKGCNCNILGRSIFHELNPLEKNVKEINDLFESYERMIDENDKTYFNIISHFITVMLYFIYIYR